jgi:hypothetical protein
MDCKPERTASPAAGGQVTMYAHRQAMGIVNDHLEGCAFRPRVEAARGATRWSPR